MSQCCVPDEQVAWSVSFRTVQWVQVLLHTFPLPLSWRVPLSDLFMHMTHLRCGLTVHWPRLNGFAPGHATTHFAGFNPSKVIFLNSFLSTSLPCSCPRNTARGFGERAVTPMGSGTKPQPTYTVATGAENTFIYFLFSVVFLWCPRVSVTTMAHWGLKLEVSG